MTDPVIIGIATFDGPGRRESLRETLESLAGQVDRIYVWANGYSVEDIVFNTDDAYELVTSDTDLGDTGKFMAHIENNSPTYCLTCDDDLIYPPDYVERMIEGIERYNRQAVVSFHGKAFTQKAYPWYSSPGPRYPCLRTVENDARITIPGTGVMGWHSSLLTVSPDDFPEPNMADIWMGKLLQERRLPAYVLAHEEGWIRHTDKIDMNTTLWRVNKNDMAKTDRMTEVFNSVDWKL